MGDAGLAPVHGRELVFSGGWVRVVRTFPGILGRRPRTTVVTADAIKVLQIYNPFQPNHDDTAWHATGEGGMGDAGLAPMHGRELLFSRGRGRVVRAFPDSVGRGDGARDLPAGKGQ